MPEKLYGMLSTSAGMEKWFLRSCLYKKTDGKQCEPAEACTAHCTYRFLWYGYDDTVNENGKILVANEPDVFCFTFNGNGETDMKVRITLEKVGEGTLVTLKQYDIPEDERGRSHWHLGCMEGWTFYLANFKSVAEGGLDLRNKDTAITGVINS